MAGAFAGAEDGARVRMARRAIGVTLTAVAALANLAGCGPTLEPPLPDILITEVLVSEAGDDRLELQNVGTEEGVLEDWWLCSGPPNYFQIPPGTTIPAGGILVVTLATGTNTATELFAMNFVGDPGIASGEMGLYHDGGDFALADNIADYMQWGGSGAREPVAVAAGLWVAGTAVDMTSYVDGTSSLIRSNDSPGVGSWAVGSPSIGTEN